MSDTLKINKENYSIQAVEKDGLSMTVRAYMNLIYVSNPVDISHQTMNIYVPEAYFSGGSINEYTAESAPIFLITTVGGYMPGWALSLSDQHRMKETAVAALMRGYVVACPASRGRGLKDAAGENIGIAPWGIVDLKAAVAFLRHNHGIIPGDTEKIIPNGGSAGGAMCALLGATGNHPDYEPYLKKIGAAEERSDVYAASCYCPITNLEHADAAYEWMFGGVYEYMKMLPPPPLGDGILPMLPPSIPTGKASEIPPEDGIKTKMNADEIEISKALEKSFPGYLNSLKLCDGKYELTLDEYGKGSFYDFIKAQIIRSAQHALDQGENFSSLSWIQIDNGKVTAVSVYDFIQYITRKKGVPAFDDLDLDTPEAELFGSETVERRHFTTFSCKQSGIELADEKQIRMMNPMSYIVSGDECRHNIAAYWRIRHGAADRDTSLAIPAILALKLKNEGYAVDFFLPWGRGHDSDYDLDELFAWIDCIVKN